MRDVKDVYVPFRINIPAGHSKFTVEIPTNFAGRKFYFAELMLTPDFYNTEAEEFGIDVDAELDQLIYYNIYLTGQMANNLWPGIFTLDTAIDSLPVATTSLNDYFEANKPDGIEHLGHFWDWTDLRFLTSGATDFDSWIRNTMAPIYYGEPFDEEKHFNKLPNSARSLPYANNYLFPTETSEILLENLRFRMWTAPNSITSYSTDGQLKLLGFTEEQIGPRGRGNQFLFANRTKMYLISLGANKPTIEISAVHQLKIGMAPAETSFVSLTGTSSLKYKDTFKNKNYFDMMLEALKNIAIYCNIQVGITYDDKEKIFTFSFPNNNSLNFAVNLPTELGKRLGFGLVDAIRRDKAKSDPVSDEPNVEHTEKMARALAFDTGMVIVSDNQVTSNLSSGITELYMASLYPTDTGSLLPSAQSFCYPPPTMELPRMLTGGPGNYPATFTLSRFIEQNIPVNLVWSTGAFVVGVMRGVALDKKL